MNLMIWYNISEILYKKPRLDLACMWLYVLIFLLSMTNSGKYSYIKSSPLRDGQLSIAAWNSRGLVASVPYLRELMRSNDIICLSEHWLISNRLNSLGEISDDFNVIARASAHSDASKYGITRGQGGVAILWRKSLSGISPMEQITHDRVCGIRTQTDSGLVLNIYSVYLPSPGCCDNFEVAIDEIAEVINTGETGTCTLLCGDFNADMGYMGGKRSNRKPTRVGKTLAGFFEELDLVAVNMTTMATGPLNTFNSGVGSSTIDYVTVPCCILDLVVGCDVLRDEIMNTSDHYAIRYTLKVECTVQMYLAGKHG